LFGVKDTGCRLSEIVNLAWSEVKSGRLIRHDSKTRLRTDLLGDVARMLLASLELRGGADPVLWNRLVRRAIRCIAQFWR